MAATTAGQKAPIDQGAVVETVRRARGRSGPNLAYVTATHAHLLDLGVEDADLTALCAALAEGDAAEAGD